MSPPALALEAVSFRYPGAARNAVDGLSLEVSPGQALGLVGESGSGKSTALMLLLGLLRPTAGQVRFEGKALDLRMKAARVRFRTAVQPVFQDPYTALDPRQRIGDLVAEPLVALGLEDNRARRHQRVVEALASVGLEADTTRRYPHAFSGGQRQRIAIARALVTQPRVLLADEPVSALDVSAKLEIIELLATLSRDHDLTLVLVSHDLSVVAALCPQAVVLQGGEVVEAGPTLRLLAHPTHPHTQALAESIPRLKGVPE